MLSRKRILPDLKKDCYFCINDLNQSSLIYMKKDIITGAIVGLIANAIGVYLYILAFSDYPFEETIQKSMNEGYFGKIVTLGAVLNLLVFFFFIKKRQDYKARGVLMVTVIIAVIVMARKFL